MGIYESRRAVCQGSFADNSCETWGEAKYLAGYCLDAPEAMPNGAAQDDRIGECCFR